jgi:predicted deacylase
LLRIGDKVVPPGSAVRLDLPVARLFTGGWLSLPVTALHGSRQLSDGRPGPRLWLDAAIHGDELNGMEIIRRVLAVLDPTRLAGVVIAVPVVNVFGFVQQTRYLPDRRDLNRSFPGSSRGSMAARLAHLFVEQVVEKCQYGIDLHTGSQHRTNLPQIRAHLADPETRRIAEAFAAPMMYTAAEIPGSLRAAARRRGVHLLVYEAGEPLRFDEAGIRTGVDGVLRVLAALGMWERREPAAAALLRGRGGRLGARAQERHLPSLGKLGEPVKRHQQLGYITAPWGDEAGPRQGAVRGHRDRVHQQPARLPRRRARAHRARAAAVGGE